jgi:hypothetical protein
MGKINPKPLAITFAVATFVLVDVAGYIWHGLLGQPSFMNILYPGFWSNWTMMGLGLVGSLVFAYVSGYVVASIYNWAQKFSK